MKRGAHSVLTTSENLSSAKDQYDIYGNKIDRSKKLVDEIAKAEQWDELKLRYSFNFFVATAVYLLLKRFFLWEIIYAVFYLVRILGTFIIDFVLMPTIMGLVSSEATIEGADNMT